MYAPEWHKVLLLLETAEFCIYDFQIVCEV
jgi:hypothetical protein